MTEVSSLTGEQTPAPDGPLSGVRVLDLVSVIMGPYATQILGDLGAEVISIEVPGGDPCRVIGGSRVPQLSGAALNLLRNKRNVTLDLKTPEGQDAFRRIVATCDVFVTNLRPKALARLNLDYEAVASARPDIVFCEAHGFATDSPQADGPAYDDVIQATSGFIDLMGRVHGSAVPIPQAIADKLCGLTMVYSITAALYHRSITGEGQRIEVPMHDVTTAFTLVEHGADAIVRPPIGPAGYGRILTPNRKPYPTSDGLILVIPYSKAAWHAFFTAGGLDPLTDPRLVSAATRAQHYDSLYADLCKIIGQDTTAAWLAFCDEHAIACAEIRSVDDLVETLPEADHPLSGRYKVIAPAVRFSRTPQSVRRPAPLIGENTDEVLAEVGYAPDEIAALHDAGVLTAGAELLA